MKQQVKNTTNYLIKQLPKATAYVNLNSIIVHISDSWIDTFDFSITLMLDTNILKIFPSLSQKWKKDIEYAFFGFKNAVKTDPYFDKNNTSSWLEWVIYPWYDEKENIIGAIIQIEDVADKILTKQKLEKLEILLKTKAEISKIGSWEYNALTNELIWCDRTKLIHEVPIDFKPNIETAINFYYEGYSKETITVCVDKAINEGKPWNEKLQITTAQGNILWVIAAGKPLFNNDKFIGLIGSFQDVTEDINNLKKTKESELLLRTLIDNLPLNVFIKYLNSRKVLVNKAECDYLGIHNDTIIGKDDFELFDEEIAKISRLEDLQVINTQKPILGKEILHIKKDGTQTSFLTSKIPLLNENQEPKGIIGFSLDITLLKEKEEELRRLVNITSLQNKKLINFAHIISHNLRSHTANFSMLLGFLIKEKDELERESLLNMLINASDNLLETLDNLNEVVAINTTTSFITKTLNLSTKVKFILKSLNHQITNKKATIVNLIPKDLNIKGNPSYIENILLNVISNAIKFAKSDVDHCVEISAEKNKDFVVFTIKDNGFGIDLEKNKDKLFGMYKTFHPQINSRGIGLYIAKNQIEAMNGKFNVESKVGVGTTFKIFFNDKY